ncbi:MAG: dihydrolipoyl dehydrogenase [Treponema sp.]|jgi:dihydrolipoamide dehydrogenase|nr:dihydrolipoyl dehydrogenase [Treponema sp.]
MYDVIVIGGGPGGYLAAERLGHRGKSVLLVEKGFLGGTCLNVGCIPTKTLLNSAKHYLHAREGAQFGVHAAEVTFNVGEMMAWKEKVVETLRAGLASQMKRCKVELVNGVGVLELKGPFRGVRVEGTLYEARAVLVATGSVPVMPPIPGAKDNPHVLDSTGLLSVKEVPAKLCVIGGGVIGIEFASLFGTLGSRVEVVEMLDEIIPPMDKDQAPLLRRSLKNTGFHLGCQVTRVDGSIEGAVVSVTTKGGKEESVEADLVLMAVGRRAETSSWGAKEAGIDVTGKGVSVDDRMRTNLPGVWAAGDVNGRSMLAHSAYRMAEVAVNDICAFLEGGSSADTMRYNAIPWAVYSIPEAAGVGLTEQEAAAKGIAVRKAVAPMLVSGRFIAENGLRSPGNVKVIVEEAGGDRAGGRILGVHILGPYASEMIWGAAALIENEMRVRDVKEMVFPHPSVCEVIREAVWNIQ